VRAWRPRRRSQAIATQSLPTMATQAPPLMAKGEDWDMIVRWVMVWELDVMMLGMGDRDAVGNIETL
jgi:hypothetical protein